MTVPVNHSYGMLDFCTTVQSAKGCLTWLQTDSQRFGHALDAHSERAYSYRKVEIVTERILRAVV
jgi:hypothetical protein